MPFGRRGGSRHRFVPAEQPLAPCRRIGLELLRRHPPPSLAGHAHPLSHVDSRLCGHLKCCDPVLEVSHRSLQALPVSAGFESGDTRRELVGFDQLGHGAESREQLRCLARGDGSLAEGGKHRLPLLR